MVNAFARSVQHKLRFEPGINYPDLKERVEYLETFAKVADTNNVSQGGFAGSITAALFLRRFAEGAGRYVHMDIYGWQPAAAPGRPKGGLGQGARAILAALPQILA